MILLDPDARPVIGHRGASGECPENTLLAFDRALEQGADALEMDVRLTADGLAVVIHDEDVDRTTNGTGLVRSLTAAGLRGLDAGAGERVPLLGEVLERYPSVPIILEVKEAAVGPAALTELQRYDAIDRVLVGSFVHEALMPFRAAGCHCSASRRETAISWASSRFGGAWLRGGFEAFAVPEQHGWLRIVDDRFVRSATRVGRPVHVWTVDEPAVGRRLRELGVAGIISNFPGRMRGLSSASVESG